MNRWFIALSSFILLIVLTFLAVIQPNPTLQAQAPNPEATKPQLVHAQIVGGEEADPGEWPWQVHIIAGPFQCGGSLIHAEWVLTAAHCLYNQFGNPFNPSDVSVVLAEHDRNIVNGIEQEIEVSRVIPHASYSSSTSDNDIGLLKLSTPAQLNNRIAIVPLIDLPTDASLINPGNLVWVTGWGATAEGSATSSLLMEVSVPIVSNKTCNQAYGGAITDNMFCAGFAQGGKDACQGDSGGPLVVSDNNGNWKLAGVVSWGIGCARAGYFGVYTNIAQYRVWIAQHIGTLPTIPTATVTPTPSTTRTPTSTPTSAVTDTGETPTPTTTAIPASNTILNGNFEQGPNGVWLENSSNFGGTTSLIISEGILPIPARGRYAAWLGGTNLEISDLSQTITIPNADGVLLKFDYWIGSNDFCDRDSASVRIGNAVLKTYALCNQTRTGEWVQDTLDLSDYRGQRLTLNFHVETNGSVVSNLYIDDVVLVTVDFTPTPTPTHTPTRTPTATPTLDNTRQPTATFTPTPTLTATPTVSLASLLPNGDFEDGANGDWTEHSSNFGGQGSLIFPNSKLPDAISANSGIYVAWLGGAHNEESRLSQTIDLPDESRVLLNYQYEILSDDVCGHGYDVATVQIDSQEVARYDLCTDQSTGDWQQAAHDISDYAGKSVQLEFVTETDGLLVSSFFVEDIFLTTQSAPRINISPELITFAAVADDENPSPQVVNIETEATTQWSLAVSSEGWLTAAPSEGVGSTQIVVSADIAELSASSYSGAVTVQANATEASLGVLLNVYSTDTPVTSALPTLIDITVKAGNQSIALNWTPTHLVDVTQYQVYRALNRTQTDEFETLGVVSSPYYADIDDDLNNDLSHPNRYCYKVEAQNAAGKSLAQSDTACANYGQLSLSVSDAIGLPSQQVIVPVNIRNANHLQISTSNIRLDFNTDVLRLGSIRSTAMTHAYDWKVEEEEVDAKTGRVIIIAKPQDEKNPDPLYGSGSLFWLIFDVLGEDGAKSALDLKDNIPGIGGSVLTVGNQSEGTRNLLLELSDGIFAVNQNANYILGDVNGDGQIDQSDVRYALDLSVAQTIPTRSELHAGDISGNGEVDAADASLILHYIDTGSWPLEPDGTNAGTALLTQKFDTTTTLRLQAVQGDPGMTVQTTLSAEALAQMGSGDFVLIYDPEVVAAIVDVEWTKETQDFVLNYNYDVSGEIRIALAGINPLSGNHDLAILTFKLAENGGVDSQLRLADATLYDAIGRNFERSFAANTLVRQNGSITIRESTETPDRRTVYLPLVTR